MSELRTPLVDHITLSVEDLATSRSFYEAALEPLGFALQFEVPKHHAVAFGETRKEADLWLAESDRPTTNLHLAFASRDRESVDRFHAAGLAAGGRDNGAPGLRPEYHENYYGAYLFDPERTNALVIPGDEVSLTTRSASR